MRIKDIIPENDPDTRLLIRGEDPQDDCEPFSPIYYKGQLQDIPEYLLNCEVLTTGTSYKEQCACVTIPYLMNNRNYDPETLTHEERKAGITVEDKQREVKTYYEIQSDCDTIAANLKGSVTE